jgi:hypothetical protein
MSTFIKKHRPLFVDTYIITCFCLTQSLGASALLVQPLQAADSAACRAHCTKIRTPTNATMVGTWNSQRRKLFIGFSSLSLIKIATKALFSHFLFLQFMKRQIHKRIHVPQQATIMNAFSAMTTTRGENK